MYVTSTKGLAGIRDAVWGLLANESIHHSWDVVCRRLLDKPLLFWEDLMQQLFLDRLQVRWEVHGQLPAGQSCPVPPFDYLGRFPPLPISTFFPCQLMPWVTLLNNEL